MRISVLTLFPEMIRPVVEGSLLGRAQEKGILSIQIYNIRDYAENKHRQADDSPFGGGNGMLMMPQPVFDCMEQATADGNGSPYRIYTSPRGTTLTNDVAKRLAQEKELVLLCGHYEGMDERVITHLIDEEISLGDYVLTGGEIPALAIIDCISRYLPGVLGNAASAEEESFNMGLLEYPQYTRPANFRGMEVPEVLLNGNHRDIDQYRRREALRITQMRRPDLLKTATLSQEDRTYLEHLQDQSEKDLEER